MRYLSLFSGFGGLDMAVEALWPDARCVAHCENDKAASQVLAHRWPDVPNLHDVTTVDWSAIGPVDAIVGGFPCQDISHAGKRAGITEETRSGLWFHFRDAIRELGPRLVLVENVAAITAAGGGLDVVLGSLAEIGFDAEWGLFRASDVGAPHRRDRWFAVAWPANAFRLGRQVQDQRQQSAVEMPVGDGTAGRAGLTMLPTPAVNDMGAGKTVEQWDAWTEDMRSRHGNGNGHGKTLPTPRASEQENRTTKRTPAQKRGEHGKYLSVEVQPQHWGEYGPAIARWEALLGRPAPDPTDAKGRLSPAFVEWMMGWPDGWSDLDGLSRAQRLKGCGNGVVTLQAIAAYQQLLDRASRPMSVPA